MSEALRLFGIVVVVVGLALRLRTTVVVVGGALTIGLTAGMPLFTSAGAPGQLGILDMLGRVFTESRYITLFIITLPAISMCERYGLKHQSVQLIQQIRAATSGRLLFIYQLARIVQGILGFRLNGHPLFVRPLIFPMLAGVAQRAPTESLKAAGAAAENYGNFYGQNLSPVQAGVLLVFGVMNGLGYAVNVWGLVLYTIPVVIASLVFGGVQYALFDSRQKGGAHAHG